MKTKLLLILFAINSIVAMNQERITLDSDIESGQEFDDVKYKQIKNSIKDNKKGVFDLYLLLKDHSDNELKIIFSDKNKMSLLNLAKKQTKKVKYWSKVMIALGVFTFTMNIVNTSKLIYDVKGYFTPTGQVFCALWLSMMFLGLLGFQIRYPIENIKNDSRIAKYKYLKDIIQQLSNRHHENNVPSSSSI